MSTKWISPPKPATVQFACVRECGEVFAAAFVPGHNEIYHACRKCGALHHLKGVHDGYGWVSGFTHTVETVEKE